ncbi:MAG: MCE family protein [Gammaproteobacteria bacterium]|nr:MCE family protein [Gammaproteobacteria bacterium]
METRANHLLIGLFVIAVFALALGCLLWLNAFGSDRDQAHYDIVFEESVIGLTKGSMVSYNGVPVGEVLSLAVDPEHLARVVVRVRVGTPDLLRQDTQATLGFSAITGVADIRLAGGSPQSPVLETRQQVPVIFASPSALSKLAASGEDIMVNLNEVAARLSDLLSPKNTEHVGKVLENIDVLVASVGEERQTLAEAIRQLSAASSQLQTTLGSIDAAARSVQGLAEGEVQQVLAGAAQALDRLDGLVAQLDGMVAENRAPLASFSNQGLRQVGPTLEELRATLAALQPLSEHLSRSDSAFLGNPQPREFTPR